MSIKYIVTGTGRCGTMFLAKYLTSAGINCGHEVIFTNNGIGVADRNLALNNYLIADSSYMSAPYLNNKILKEAKIIHLVRDPIKVINSFVVGYHYFWSPILNCNKIPQVFTYSYPPLSDPNFKFMNFIYSHVPKLMSTVLSPIERAALYYIEWNKIIENNYRKRNFLLFPIESNLEKLNNFIGIEDSEMLHKDKKTNSYEHDIKYSLSSIKKSYIRNELLSMGLRYGYFKTLML